MRMFLLLSLAILAQSALAFQCFAECADGDSGTTITNSSKYNLLTTINKVPSGILLPGVSMVNPAPVREGANKVAVQVIDKKGQIVNSVLGPKPTTLTGDCDGGLRSILNFTNKNFVKHKGTSKPAGNKKGQKVDLTGQWIQYNNGEPGECILDLIEGTPNVTGFFSCASGTTGGPLQGQNLGVTFSFLAVLATQSGNGVLVGGDLDVFGDFGDEVFGEDSDVKLDALIGTFVRLETKLTKFKQTFIRIR